MKYIKVDEAIKLSLRKWSAVKESKSMRGDKPLLPYKPALIRTISRQIRGDKYSRDTQCKQLGQDWISAEFEEFVVRNMIPITMNQRVLDIGCGEGNSLVGVIGAFITDAIEPCLFRRKKALEVILKRGGKCTLSDDFSENMNFSDKTFDNVLCLDTIDQVRSLMETFAEVNRVLKMGGMFIFDCFVDDSKDIYYGVVYGPNNLRRQCEDFGFQCQELRIADGIGMFSMKKVEEWDPRMLSKPQVVGGKVVNFFPDMKRDRKLL